MTLTSDKSARSAARFVGVVWAAISSTGGATRPSRHGHVHFSEAVAPNWLARQPLPIDANRPPDVPVALVGPPDRDGANEFERHTDITALTEAYTARPRTRLYEAVQRGDSSWIGQTCHHLGRLSKSNLEVLCSVFQSTATDEKLPAHWDMWYGVVVQAIGLKEWTIGTGLFDGPADDVQTVTTKPGDILILPKGLPHTVSTPVDPGYSVHLAFALNRDNQTK